jgi:predicted PurR-regulated permease PerM
MSTETEKMYQQLGEKVLYNGADNLIYAIMLSIFILYILSYAYKKLSFEYMKKIVGITTICFTLSYSYVFYIEDYKSNISKEIRELQLRQIESSNQNYKNQIEIYIKDLKEITKKISDSVDLVTKTTQGFSYIAIIFLMLLFFFELFLKIKPHITPNFLKKNKKVVIHWREKRKRSVYYNLKGKR